MGDSRVGVLARIWVRVFTWVRSTINANLIVMVRRGCRAVMVVANQIRRGGREILHVHSEVGLHRQFDR